MDSDPQWVYETPKSPDSFQVGGKLGHELYSQSWPKAVEETRHQNPFYILETANEAPFWRPSYDLLGLQKSTVLI